MGNKKKNYTMRALSVWNLIQLMADIMLIAVCISLGLHLHRLQHLHQSLYQTHFLMVYPLVAFLAFLEAEVEAEVAEAFLAFLVGIHLEVEAFPDPF